MKTLRILTLMASLVVAGSAIAGGLSGNTDRYNGYTDVCNNGVDCP